MSQWLFATTLFFLGVIVWIFAVFFSSKELLNPIKIGSAIISLIGLAILFHKKYYVLAGILFCIMGLMCLIELLLLQDIQKIFPWINSQSKQGGYVGKKGVSISILDPRGKVLIEEQEMDAQSEGIFIAEGEKVQVIREHQKRLVVEKINS